MIRLVNSGHNDSSARAVRESETRYRRIVETALEGIWTIDTEGRTTFANRQMADMLGTTVETMMARHSFDYVFDEDRQAAAREFSLKSQGDKKVFEFRLRREDGTALWANISGTPMYEGGELVGLLAMFTDITQRKQSEEDRHLLLDRLRSEHARISAILESISDAFYAVDSQFRFTYVNGKAEHLWGRRRENLLHRHIWSEFPSAVGSHSYEMHQRVMTERQAVHYETISPLVGQWIGVSLYPEPGGGLSCYFQNIAERKRDEEQRRASGQLLARQAAELARSNADLQQFAYVTSHDLQEPLRTITSFAQLLSRRYTGKLDEQADEYLDLIVSGTGRMKELIGALLNYSRAVNREERPHGPVDLREALDWALQNLRTQIQETGGEVQVDKLPEVWGDELQLSQLFQNLISNAIKYRKPGEPPAISVSAQRRDPDWVISVKDNGIGVDAEFAERIFGVFKRLHGQDVPGTGIGLAICKRIVHNHGGRIWVDSEKGEGSDFQFTLRAGPEPPADLTSEPKPPR